MSRRHATPPQLADAMMQLGPLYRRWTEACLPGDGVSAARLRLLSLLACHGEQTMSQLASQLEVTPRRVTALVDALVADNLVSRRPHPTDRRSTLVAATSCGESDQMARWAEHQAAVGDVFRDLTGEQRDQFLALTQALTASVRDRLSRSGACGECPGVAC